MTVRSWTGRPLVAAGAAGALLLTGGCGGEEASAPVAVEAAPSPSSAAADPQQEWLTALSGLCRDFAGKVSGRQMADFADDGKYTPEEILAADQDARAAVEAFDAGYAALPAVPEAAEAKAAFDAFLAASRGPQEQLLAAAKAGDQAALTKAFSGLEAVRLGPAGIPGFTAEGVPENCRFRASYS